MGGLSHILCWQAISLWSCQATLRDESIHMIKINGLLPLGLRVSAYLFRLIQQRQQGWFLIGYVSHWLSCFAYLTLFYSSI